MSQDREDELERMIKEGILAETQHLGTLAYLESNVVERNTEYRNEHRRDHYIRFEATGHKYYLRQEEAEIEFPISVSGVWSQYFAKFDAERTIARYYMCWAGDPGSKYFAFIHSFRDRGVPDTDIARRIKLMWSDKGELASAFGTRMHRQIELALTANMYDVSMGEMQTFVRFVKEVLEPRQWRLYRAEWTIYDEIVMVAGQIDAMFVDGEGKFHMVDWKRVRHDLLPHSGQEFHRYGLCFCEHLLDNHFNHYALQQNLYAAILRRRYDMHVSSMALVQIHPELTGYQVHDVPEWTELANNLLNAAGGAAQRQVSARLALSASPQRKRHRYVETRAAYEHALSTASCGAEGLKVVG